MIRTTAYRLILIAVALFGCFPAQYALGKGLRYDCQYNAVTSYDGLKETSFALQFVYDTITEEAILIGNQGFSEVHPIFGFEALTFLEPLPNGTVQVTAISFFDGSSVHSRHTLIPVPEGGVQFLPSQYFGKCQESKT